MSVYRSFIIALFVVQLTLCSVNAQPVLPQAGGFQARPGTGVTNLRITSQSADGTEVVLTMECGYDGFGGPTALAVPVIEKRGQKGVAAWFGADPVAIGVGKGLISIKVKYFNDEPGVPPQFTSDSLRILILNRSGTAILSSIPFLKTIKWGSADAKPGTIALAQASAKSEEASNPAKSRQEAEAQARAQREAEGKAKAEAKTSDAARAKAEAEAKARQKTDEEAALLAEKKERQETERKLREDARLKADAEAKRLAEEKRLAEQKAREETKARAEARRQADAEAKARREAEQKARAEAAAREAQQRKAEAEAKRLAEETRKAEDKAQAEAKAKEKARLAAAARARDEARKKAEAEAKRIAEETRIAEAKARAEAEARERAQLRAEAEEKARQEAERKEKAEAEAREAARLKAEAETKRLAEEKRLAEQKAEAARRAEQARLAEQKTKPETKPLTEIATPPPSAAEILAATAPLATGLKTKITNVDVVNRSLDRSQMTIGVEYDYKDSLGTKPMLGVDVTKMNEPGATRYFQSAPAEIGKSRRNFVLFPIKFQPPATFVSLGGYATDNLLVYLLEATSAQRFNLYPATMLLTWRPPGLNLSASAKPEGSDKIELDDFKQNDPHAGYVTVKYNLTHGPGKLRVRLYNSENPASADWFAIDPKTVKAGPGLQIFDVAVAPEAKTPGNIVKVDTLKIELLDASGKIVKEFVQKVPMTWAKPE